MRLALVSSEVSPFIGGGIAPIVRATAQLMAARGHVVDVFTRESFLPQARRLNRTRMPLFAHPNVRWHWVREPQELGLAWHTGIASAFLDAILAAYRGGPGPDVLELQDYLGLGAFIAHERARGTPPLTDTVVATRLHTSSGLVRALDAHEPDDRANRGIYALERETLEHSDVLLAPSASAAELYRGAYPELALPPVAEFWPAFLRDDAPQFTPAAVRSDDVPLQLLYMGRMQRLKGVDLLVRAFRADPQLDARIMLVGGDTPTGPDGTSMVEELQRLAAGDRRIQLVGAVPRARLGTFLGPADAVIIPSRWEMWGNVGLEALAAARPLLVTPVGSLPQMAGDGKYGLVAERGREGAISDLLARAVADKARLRALSGSRELTDHLDRLTDDDRVAEHYVKLASASREDRPEPPDAREFEELLGRHDAQRGAPLRHLPNEVLAGDDEAS